MGLQPFMVLIIFLSENVNSMSTQHSKEDLYRSRHRENMKGIRIWYCKSSYVTIYCSEINK